MSNQYFQPYNVQSINMLKYEGFTNIGNSTSDNKTIMKNETQLLTDLKAFNQSYADYVNCTYAYMNNGGTQTTCDMRPVTAAYNKLSTVNAMGIVTGGDIPKTFNSNVDNGVTNEVYDASYNYIKQTYNNDIIKLRSDLDAKMKELYSTNDSLQAEYKTSFDSTILAGLLWTVLATSTVYFVFTKL